MIIIGIDVSKLELVAVAINKTGRTQRSWSVPNDKSKIEEWLEDLLTTYPHLALGSEATGEYHNGIPRL